MTAAPSPAEALLERIRSRYIRPVKVQRNGHLRDDNLLPAIGPTRAGLGGFEIQMLVTCSGAR
ncbi:hypothetical protein BAY61_31835 (plasmid) [Prauserella marina]|uniref:Uncharacterized protein n=1 Tax=Prauserella marina TaxID=530584 RepID=A0A222W0Y9_9PSEU|nr:hypothetical protein [Prauserella marina]ASR39878.1 hypothetical protein BAY61_31835 [Prauserella marina]PWV71373.1 hypothetical protein DES30_11289 [Prauserella marina]SDD95544.1 hypothetical protein SAMN05421630_11523 [Prauserella marina]